MIKKVEIISNLKISLFVMILLLIGLITPTYATEIEIETLENKIDDTNYSSLVSEKIIGLKENDLISNILSQSISETLFENIGLASNSSYDLRDYYDIDVKDQGDTEMCWAFSLLSSVETNMQIKLGISVDLSEQHMNYATSESFYDGTNEYGFNREAYDGGNFIIGLAYLTNGQGAVLEEEMPFTGDTSSISLEEIDIDASYYVTGYDMLPTIYKISSDDELLYTDGNGEYYDEDEVDALRDIIKEHIVEYGGVSAYICVSALDYYNDSSIVNATAYYCDNMDYEVDHAVTIIGWDDNYSKENFTGSAMPSEDGAYIVLYSYSDEWFDCGCLYVSYEDVWIESCLYGITSTSTIDYDNLYQHDEFGANIAITLTSGGSNFEEGYYASTYERDSETEEYLSQVSISSNQYASFEIYVNSSGEDLTVSNLTLVATTSVLSPGYNTISFDEIELTGEKFAIVVKQCAVDETYYFVIEAKMDDTYYENVSANEGDSVVSLDGTNWVNLADLGSIAYGDYTIDLSDCDVCIKAYTVSGSNNDTNSEGGTGDEITSDTYTISEDNYITGIYHNTDINSFLANMEIEEDYYILDKNDDTVTDYSSLTTTNMKLIVNETIYYLVVRGDLNGDGKITITDISKHALHYVGYEGHVLTGAFEKATDINLDGELTITDLSQLRLIYVSL